MQSPDQGLEAEKRDLEQKLGFFPWSAGLSAAAARKDEGARISHGSSAAFISARMAASQPVRRVGRQFPCAPGRAQVASTAGSDLRCTVRVTRYRAIAQEFAEFRINL